MRTFARLIALALGASLGAGALAGAVVLVGSQVSVAAKSVRYVAPDPGNLAPLDQRSLVLDRNGRVIAVLHAEQNRSPVAFNRVPKVLVNAILAVEDSKFYQHKGVNLRATVRAFGANVEAGGVAQGGSTITQQLVKKSLLTSKQEIGRKIREAVLSLELEKKLSKNEILGRYLNEVYFGQGAYGVQAASERYFQHPVEKITIAEAAFLAGMIRNPVGYDPTRFRDRSRARRAVVLDRMVAVGMITADDAAQLKKAPMPRPADRLAKPDTYFIESVKQELLNDRRLGDTPKERYESVFNGGLRIKTTFDPVAQAQAERAVIDVLPKDEPDFTAAVASVDVSTGAVRAMVGGRGFETDKYNLVTQGLRQPGSSWKPFVFLAALERGISPQSYLSGVEPCPIPNPGGKPDPFEPQNAGDATGKVASISEQLVASSNCAFARLAYITGYDNIIDVARRAGITTTIEPVPSMALGVEEVHPIEMAGAYATLATGGVKRTAHTIEEVRNRSNKLLFKAEISKEQIFDPNMVAVVVDAMTQVVQRGTGTAAQLRGRQVAGKTGTTNDYEDAWFVGFTPQVATAVWMGAPKGKIAMKNVGGIKVFGGTYPARIWQKYMSDVLEGTPRLTFAEPNYKVFGKTSCLTITDEPKATKQGKANAAKNTTKRRKSTSSALGSVPFTGRGFAVNLPDDGVRLPGAAGPAVPRATRTSGKYCQDSLGGSGSSSSSSSKKKKKRVTVTTVAGDGTADPAPIQAANTVAPVEPAPAPEPAPEPVPVATAAPEAPPQG